MKPLEPFLQPPVEPEGIFELPLLESLKFVVKSAQLADAVLELVVDFDVLGQVGLAEVLRVGDRVFHQEVVAHVVDLVVEARRGGGLREGGH